MALPSYIVLADFKARGNLPASLTDAALTSILTAIGGAITAYLGFDPIAAAITEYLDTNGSEFVPLTRWPLANAAAVTSVYYDRTGNYGQTPGAFASTTLLTQGTDYSVSFPSGSGVARLYRINNWWDWRWTREPNRLSSFQGSLRGDLKVVYTVTNTDLIAACTEAAYAEGLVRARLYPWGVGTVMSDSVDGMGVSIQAWPPKPGAVQDSADAFYSPFVAGMLRPWKRTRLA